MHLFLLAIFWWFLLFLHLRVSLSPIFVLTEGSRSCRGFSGGSGSSGSGCSSGGRRWRQLFWWVLLTAVVAPLAGRDRLLVQMLILGWGQAAHEAAVSQTATKILDIPGRWTLQTNWHQQLPSQKLNREKWENYVRLISVFLIHLQVTGTKYRL